MYKNVITLSGIISRLLKNPVLENLSEDDAIESALDCVSLIGTASMFKEAVTYIDVENQRGAIPQDATTIKSIRYVDNEADSRDRIPMRPATDTYHLSMAEASEDYNDSLNDITYSINGNFIYTSFTEGKIEISYNTLNVNEIGELLLPDDINVIRAVESYITVKYLEPLWMMGKIADKVYSKFEQDYDWYVGKAQTSTRELSLDERDSLSNMLTTLVDNRDHRGDFYKNLTQQEYRVRHR